MRASWSRVCVGAVGCLGLAASVCPFTSDVVFSNPHPNPAGSIHATSVAASRVEQALSEVASSLQSSAPKQGPLHPWMTLAQIWLHAGTVLPPAPPGLLLHPRGGVCPGRQCSRESRATAPQTASAGYPEVQWSCFSSEPQFPPLNRGVHRTLSWGDEPRFPPPHRGVHCTLSWGDELSAPCTLAVISQRPWERGRGSGDKSSPSRRGRGGTLCPGSPL